MLLAVIVLSVLLILVGVSLSKGLLEEYEKRCEAEKKHALLLQKFQTVYSILKGVCDEEVVSPCDPGNGRLPIQSSSSSSSSPGE